MALAEASDIAAAQRASGSSFYNAMRVLPRAQREAMFEIYSFCRQVDDIADSSAPCSERREQLQRWRADIDALYADRPVLRTRGLVAPVRDFGLRREDFHAVIDGMEMDVLENIRAPDEATLDAYCNRVASAVGRLSVKVFGMDDGPGFELAHHSLDASPAMQRFLAEPHVEVDAKVRERRTDPHERPGPGDSSQHIRGDPRRGR